jgi:hypothetical protein
MAALGAAAVNRASVVLLCGHLEGFAEDLLAEALDSIVASGVQPDRISNVLRYRHARRDAQGLAGTADVDSFADQLRTLIARNQSLAGAKRLVAGDIDVEVLQREFADPKPDKVFSLFGILGLSKEAILRSFQGYSLRQAIIARVDSLVSIRHEIAHGVATSSATQQDVFGYMTAVAMFAARLDLAVQAQISAVRSGPGSLRSGYFRIRSKPN